MNEPSCITELLKNAAALTEHALNEALSELKISHCQAQIILALQDGPTSMSTISGVLCCHKSNVTHIVDGLVRKGMLERIRSTKDRRVCELTLTARGHALCRHVDTAIRHHAEEALASFADDDRQTLIRLLQEFVRQRRKRKATLTKGAPTRRAQKRAQ